MPLRLQRHILQHPSQPRPTRRPKPPTQPIPESKKETRYYLTYNNKDYRDGAGAQIQRILSLFFLAKKLGFGYVHQHFVTDHHGVNQDILKRFNELIELEEYQKTDFDQILYYDSFTEEVVSSLQYELNKDILLVIGTAHTYVDQNPNILNDLFPKSFSWIEDKLNEETQVALHIRRGHDVTPTMNTFRFVELSHYLEYLKFIKQILVKPYKIHLFSQEEIRKEIHTMKDFDPDIILHIDEDVVETFKCLVNCDILFAGRSSFSYSAAMLRRKGIVLYNPFWHSYPKKHLCVQDPSDIIKNQEIILQHIM